MLINILQMLFVKLIKKIICKNISKILNDLENLIALKKIRNAEISK